MVLVLQLSAPVNFVKGKASEVPQSSREVRRVRAPENSCMLDSRLPMRSFAALVLAVLVIGTFPCALRADEPTYTALKRIEWPETSMYAVLRDMLSEVPGIDLTRVNLGGNYQLHKINAIIVDSSRFETIHNPVGQGFFSISFDQLYLNAIAFDNNVVALDSDWLSLILLFARHRQDASMDYSHPNPGAALEDGDDVLRFHLVVDDARRGEILFDFINRLPSRIEFREEAKRILVGLVNESENGQTAYREAIRTYALAFLPILIHELAHLDTSIDVFDAHNSKTVEKMSQLGRNSIHTYVTRQEEDRADGVAIARLTPLVERWKSEMHQNISQGATEAARHLISLEAFALMQRDIVLIRAFSNFRGYRFQDVFYSIYHEGCDTSAAQPTKIGFYDFHKIALAFNEPIPVLTSAEYARLHATLDPPINQTHAHGFHRAAELLRLVQSGGKDSAMEEIEQFESLLAHLRGDGSNNIPFHLEFKATRMNYRVTDFFNVLRGSEAHYGHRYTTERAALCPSKSVTLSGKA